MNKLPPLYQFVIALLASIAVFAAVYFLIIGPQREALNNLRLEQSQLEARDAEYRAAAAALPALKEKVAKLEIERAEFVKALPTTAEFGQVTNQLRQTVASAGGELKSLGFRNADNNAQNAVPGVRPMAMDLSISGKYGQVFQILQAMETQNRFTTVSGVAMQLPTASSFDPKLEGTLNLIVYTFDPSQVQMPTAPAGQGGPTVPGGGTQ